MTPTPGPYKIVAQPEHAAYAVYGNGDDPIALFIAARMLDRSGAYALTFNEAQARANAEAWIAGVAALSKIPRLKAAYEATRGSGTTSQQWAEFYDALHALIDEP